MKRKKLLPKQHTGKLVHRHNTNYGLLLMVLMLVLLPLFAISSSTAALSAPPVEGSEGVYAVVAAPVPSTAPVITSITNGQVFHTPELVPISGTCPQDTIIKVYKNQVMAGSTLCENGRFSVKIDLFIGANSIIARPYNSNNVAGPDSAPVNVSLIVGDVAGGLHGPGSQLFITSDSYFQGVRTKETLAWPIMIAGGQAPYAVSVGWGDGKTDLISRAQAGIFDIKHVYDKAGNGYRGSYDVTISATDQAGTKAFLQLVVVVSDSSPSALTAAKAGYNGSRILQIAWQLFVAGMLVIMVFWFGEQYEIRVMKRKYKLA